MLLITNMDHGTTDHSTSGSLGDFFGSESCFNAVEEECATPPHVHPTSRYTIIRDQFYQAFPCLSIASDKHWSEKSCYKANPISPGAHELT